MIDTYPDLHMSIEKAIYNRASLLVGDAVMARLAAVRVIVFGVGGVGSWCAESLVRSGVTHVTIVDSDRVCVTNVNRQCMATMRTIGMVKVEAMKARLLEINPRAEVEAVQAIYSAETRASFHLEDYDFVIDAIDSLECKAELIRHATSLPRTTTLFSSMGAALKMDPTQVRVDEFWQVKGCPLARALRQKFKRQHDFPRRKFCVVYSPEVLPNLGQAASCGTAACMCPKAAVGPGRQDLLNHEWCSQKAQLNGTMAHTTAQFGFMLAGLVVQTVYRATLSAQPD